MKNKSAVIHPLVVAEKQAVLVSLPSIGIHVDQVFFAEKIVRGGSFCPSAVMQASTVVFSLPFPPVILLDGRPFSPTTLVDPAS